MNLNLNLDKGTEKINFYRRHLVARAENNFCINKCLNPTAAPARMLRPPHRHRGEHVHPPTTVYNIVSCPARNLYT